MSWDKPITIKRLKTKAKSEVRGKKMPDRDVYLGLSGPDNSKWAYKWTLVIEDSSGRWYLSTLLERPERLLGNTPLAIDFGQEWYWTNPSDVLAEALRLI